MAIKVVYFLNQSISAFPADLRERCEAHHRGCKAQPGSASWVLSVETGGTSSAGRQPGLPEGEIRGLGLCSGTTL